MVDNLKKAFRQILRYPSAVAGILMILAMAVVAVYAVVTIPYQDAISMWRSGEDVWYANPKTAPPKWYNWFTVNDMPASLDLNSADEEDGVEKIVETRPDGTRDITMTYTFDFPYDVFPPEVTFFFKSQYESKQPFVSITWIPPDGREIRIADFGVSRSFSLRLTQDARLKRRLGGLDANIGLFAQPDSDPLQPLRGTYTILVQALTFEPDSNVDAEFVMYGLVHGWAGTDHLRRDLMLPLLWGTPVALAFGLVAALGTSITTMTIAAMGVWFGGWIDEFIQRITEVNLILPFLPILIMIGYFYSRSIWVILGVTILLSIFTGAIKTQRAIFMQVKESTYIEAAQAYGAGDFRIIFRYLIPRIIPILIPGLVASVPAFVFLEASLAVLGLGDPVLPTWGKMVFDAQTNGALYNGQYYWILEPAVLLMITGLGFAVLGYTLDRIFNPRLRGL
jgi:peptide/nickel transport system permease protein